MVRQLTRRDGLVVVCSAMWAGSLQACSVFGPSHTVRFRLQVHGSSPEADVNGSAVIQSAWADTGPLSQQGRWRATYSGEAPYADLGRSRALVALLGTVTGYSGGFTATGGIFHELFPDGDAKDEDAYWERLSQSSKESDLPRKYWPLFAYFPDVKDLTGARMVSVEELGSAAAVTIDRVRLQITRDPVTEQLGARLPWLEQIGKFQIPATQPVSSLPVFQKFEQRNFHATGDVL